MAAPESAAPSANPIQAIDQAPRKKRRLWWIPILTVAFAGTLALLSAPSLLKKQKDKATVFREQKEFNWRQAADAMIHFKRLRESGKSLAEIQVNNSPLVAQVFAAGNLLADADATLKSDRQALDLYYVKYYEFLYSAFFDAIGLELSPEQKSPLVSRAAAISAPPARDISELEGIRELINYEIELFKDAQKLLSSEQLKKFRENEILFYGFDRTERFKVILADTEQEAVSQVTAHWRGVFELPFTSNSKVQPFAVDFYKRSIKLKEEYFGSNIPLEAQRSQQCLYYRAVADLQLTVESEVSKMATQSLQSRRSFHLLIFAK